MGALLLLVLAAEPASSSPPSPPEEEEPAWDQGAQSSVMVMQSLNGLYLGLAVCGAATCSSDGGMPFVFGAVGAGAGLALSLIDREPARGWGRAAFLDSAIMGAGLFGLLMATAVNLGGPLGYSVLFLFDAALTAAALVTARHISPRPETVWLADSLGLWGGLLGANTAALFLHDPRGYVVGGAMGGLALGALLAASAQRMTGWRILFANVGALLGGLLLGGGLWLYESGAATPERPYDPLVPAVGAAAGIAGGFLAGFALSESF